MEKGGLAAALAGAELSRDDAVLHADELRLGLRGQVRRVLAPRGVKVVQRVQIEYQWRWLLLGVDPRSGSLRWRWLERCRQEHLTPVLAEWAAAAVVWDGAGAHRGKWLRDVPAARIALPPYSPELNPTERVFAEVRRRVEGRVYADLDAKQARPTPASGSWRRTRRGSAGAAAGAGSAGLSTAFPHDTIAATVTRTWYKNPGSTAGSFGRGRAGGRRPLGRFSHAP